MSISAHGRSRLYWVWRWTSGLRRSVRPGDPHLGRRERVHPGDDADAVGRASASRRTAAIASGVVTTGFGDDADRDVGAPRRGRRRWPARARRRARGRLGP